MSFRAGTWAYEQDVTTVPKFILVMLAQDADEFGYCFLSLKRLAKLCAISKPTVMKYIKELEGAGLIGIERRTLENGSVTSNRYHLMVPEGVTLSNQKGPDGQDLACMEVERD